MDKALGKRITAALLRRPEFTRKSGGVHYSQVARTLSQNTPVTRQSVKSWCDGNVQSIRNEYLYAIATLTGVEFGELAGLPAGAVITIDEANDRVDVDPFPGRTPFFVGDEKNASSLKSKASLEHYSAVLEKVLTVLRDKNLELTPQEISAMVTESVLQSEEAVVNEAYIYSIVKVLSAGKGQ